MPDELRIVGPFATHSGYSKLTRAVLRTALLAGYRVEARESDYTLAQDGFLDGRVKTWPIYARPKPSRPLAVCQAEEVTTALKTRIGKDAPTLFVQIPDGLGQRTEFSYGPRIGLTMLESDRLCPDWERSCSGVDYLLTPSSYCLDTFRRQVPHILSDIFPALVDDRLYCADEPTGGVTVSGRLPAFTFFSVFSTLPRKQWIALMQAFAEEFAPEEDVALVVKPTRVNEVAELAGWLSMDGNSREVKRKIVVLTKWLSDEALAAWYRRCDCYVLPSSEGCGLPFIEAALCGKPSVALSLGGASDFVDHLTGYSAPARMGQVLGQFPHVYTSEHRFAVPESFASLRTALRDAYEWEMTGSGKGEWARHVATERHTPEAVAPALREAVEKAQDVFKGRTRLWASGQWTKWAVCVGDGYGDALATLGNAESVLKWSGGAIGVLHYGTSKGVADFLRSQPMVTEVRQIEPPDKGTFDEIANDAGGYYSRPVSAWLPRILEGTGIDPAGVALTQVHWPWATWTVNRPTNLVLPQEAHEWADAFRAEQGEYLLVQPYSVGNSVTLTDHWPHWAAFMRWLIQTCEGSHRLVFVGQMPLHGLAGRPNVVDLIGQTPTMEHVFALAQRARGVVSTCNALGVWTACQGPQGTPALIAANAAIPKPHSYWYRWQDCAPNTLLPYQATLARFTKAAEKWLGGLGK
jgi:hypothetical protein